MKIKKKYSIGNKRTIWRLIPSGEKLLIEERDEGNKQVYFSCIEIESGKCILKDYQLDEKFWVGVESFEKDKIFFHGYIKPDMPGHIGITVYDLTANHILWNRDNAVFLFLYENEVFAFLQKFESREFFSFDAETGEPLKNYGENTEEINSIREKLLDEQYDKFKNYHFPEPYFAGKLPPGTQEKIERLKENVILSGEIDYVNYNNSLLLSFHSVRDDGKLDNIFRIIEIEGGKIIFEYMVNSGISSYIPDTFFIKDNLLFLIKDKIELMVYSLI